MSKKKSSSKSSAPPAAPPPQNEYYYENGVLKSDRVYDSSKNAYLSNAYSTPQEQQIESMATDQINKLVGEIPNAVNLSPEAIAGYGEAYAKPQIDALTNSYNQASGAANMAASSRGMRNSVGFEGYRANQLEKNKAQGLADIAANRKLMELDLPNKMLMPYTNQFNLINAALNGEQASMNQDYNNAAQGSVNANNAVNQSYQNQMNAWQAQQQQRQNQSRGGLFSFFTGGV